MPALAQKPVADPLRVVVCGSGYALAYLLALAGQADYKVVALLARGSERSQTLAISCGLPLYRDVARLPPADIACVALPAPAARDVGLRLLDRGLHLVLEHPVTASDLETLLARAATRGRAVFVNSHFGDLPHVQAFIASCRDAASGSRALFISAMGTRRSRFSLLDIVCRIASPLAGPSALEPVPHPGPLRTSVGEVAGIPCLVQHTAAELCAAVDDGSDQHVGHRVTVAFATRTLTLVDTWGPVVETQVPGTRWDARPAGPWEAPVRALRDRATRRVLDNLARFIRCGACCDEQRGAYLMTLARLWTSSR